MVNLKFFLITSWKAEIKDKESIYRMTRLRENILDLKMQSKEFRKNPINLALTIIMMLDTIINDKSIYLIETIYCLFDYLTSWWYDTSLKRGFSLVVPLEPGIGNSSDGALSTGDFGGDTDTDSSSWKT